MGSSMALRLIGAGHEVSVWTRSRDKASAVIDAGATWADGIPALAAECEIICSMVGYPADVDQVYGELLETGGRLRIAIDFTTSEPGLARRLAEQGRTIGVAVLDAPVSGGDVGARNGTLSIMVGGDANAFEEVKPLLEPLGKTIVYQGEAGSGQHTKMVNQTLIATNMIGVCEALLYAEKSGLDPTRVLKSVSGGAAGSWSLQNLAPRMLAGDFAPGFFVEHFIKDMGIALGEAEAMNLALPGLALAKQLYEALRAQGSWARRHPGAVSGTTASQRTGLVWCFVSSRHISRPTASLALLQLLEVVTNTPCVAAPSQEGRGLARRLSRTNETPH